MRPGARHRRTALFLGAGASAAFGRPTTDGILPQTECQFEYGEFEAFIESLPEPEKHYPVF